MEKRIKIDQNICIGCGACAADCPQHAITIENGRAVYTAARCLECGHCFAVCPAAAVTMEGYDLDECVPCGPASFVDPAAFLTHMKARRSIRQFSPRPVEREKLEQIIEAGRFTPTGKNRQRIRYVVVNSPETTIEPPAVRLFAEMMQNSANLGIGRPQMNAMQPGFFFFHAPVAILVISDIAIDAAFAAVNMGTMAEALGLGVLYVGFYARAAKLSEEIRAQIGLKGREEPVAVLALGYPDVQYCRTPPRKKAVVEWR